MYKNFIIAGLGGSGTKFLATMLNKSESWYVSHEGMRDNVKGWDVSHIHSCLEHKRTVQNYGDVNGFIRNKLHLIHNVDKKAIILRNTKDILRSWYDHWQGWNTDKKVKEYANHRLYNLFVHTAWTVKNFEQYIKDGIKVIQFSKMVKDLDYLNDIVKWCGIDDLVLQTEDVKKINSHYKKRITYEEIPERDRYLWENITENFNQKYVK
jgi:hypothetical protein